MSPHFTSQPHASRGLEVCYCNQCIRPITFWCGCVPLGREAFDRIGQYQHWGKRPEVNSLQYIDEIEISIP